MGVVMAGALPLCSHAVLRGDRGAEQVDSGGEGNNFTLWSLAPVRTTLAGDNRTHLYLHHHHTVGSWSASPSKSEYPIL